MIIRKADKSDLKKAYEVYSKVLKKRGNGTYNYRLDKRSVSY